MGLLSLFGMTPAKRSKGKQINKKAKRVAFYDLSYLNVHAYYVNVHVLMLQCIMQGIMNGGQLETSPVW